MIVASGVTKRYGSTTVVDDVHLSVARGGVTADGRRIVPAYWIDWMTQMSDVSNGRYGFQTWSSSAGDQAFMASGFHGQKITVLPEVCMSAVRLSHSFGLQYRDGDDIFNPDAYGFGTNFSAPEWDAMLRDISKQIGGCDGSSPSFTQAAAQGGSSSGAMSPLPLLLLALLALLRHRRQPR